MKTLQVGAGVFHSDRWLDGWMDRYEEASGRFSRFLNLLKKETKLA
jgi:hypothetical protein